MKMDCNLLQTVFDLGAYDYHHRNHRPRRCRHGLLQNYKICEEELNREKEEERKRTYENLKLLQRGNIINRDT